MEPNRTRNKKHLICFQYAGIWEAAQGDTTASSSTKISASSPPTLQALGMFLLLRVGLFLRKVSVIYVIFLFTYPKGKKEQKFVCKRSTLRLPEMEEAHLTDEKLSCPQRGQDSLFHPLLASSTFSVSHLKLFGKLCRQKTSLLKFTKRTWRVKKLPDY